MKLISKRAAALTLAAAMAAGLMAGCNGKSSSGSTSTATGDTASDSGEITTLTWYMSINPVAADTAQVIEKLNEYTRDKIGVEIDYKVIANPDYKEKMPNLINAGEYFDICFTSNWTTDYLQFVGKDAFMDITELLPEYAKETYDFIPQAMWNAVNVPDTTYPITIADTDNGTVSTNLTNASAGATITITAEPDEGYSVGRVVVTGPDGRLDVTRVNATTYTFKMPEGDVEVEVEFVSGEEALPFTDVTAGAWYYDAVSYVYFNGMMEGDSATTFNPDGTMTRAMFWAVLGRIDGASITGSNWAEAAREWAVTNGVSDGENASGLVTREQMVTMLWRYVGEPESSYSLSAYSDAASVSDWAEEAMSWALENGIVEGMTATTLEPQSTATRAQCATIFMRYDALEA